MASRDCNPRGFANGGGEDGSPPPKGCALRYAALTVRGVIGRYTGTIVGIATAQQAADAWEAGANAATQKWADNLRNTSKPIVAAAIAKQSLAISNYTASLTSGRWADALNQVGDSGVKAAAAAKSGNYGVGIGAAKPKYLSKIGPLLSYIASGLPTLEAMPSGTTAAGVARATYWIQYMAAAKGL